MGKLLYLSPTKGAPVGRAVARRLSAHEAVREALQKNGRTDRMRVERAAVRAYRAIRLPAPARIFWFRSPAEALCAIEMMKSMRGMNEHEPNFRSWLLSLGNTGWSLLDQTVFRRLPVVPFQLGRNVWSGSEGSAGERYINDLARTGRFPLHGPPVSDGIAAIQNWKACRRFQSQVELVVRNAMPGGARLASSFFRSSLELRSQCPHLLWHRLSDLQAAKDGSEPLSILANGVSAWWGFSGAVILVELPRTAHLDASLLLHHPSGPALEFPDGLQAWAWDGVLVDRQIIEHRGPFAPAEVFRQTNSEIRRIMIEKSGYEQFLAQPEIVPLHRNRRGELFRIQMGPQAEPLAVVRVRNSTPEPDGSFRYYYLRVPPRVRTVDEAVAWTFGLNAGEYRPQVET